MKSPFSKILISALLMGLCACAKAPLTPVSHDTDALWTNYAKTAQNVTTPFRTQLSLRYGFEGDTDRVQALLWGNTAKKLRLDITAGVGITVAKIYEDEKIFTLYVPNEETAYVHEGAQKPLFNVGVPMPLGLHHLTLILQGHYASVFGLNHSNTPLAPKDTTIPQEFLADLPEDAVAYHVNDGDFAGTLVLNSLGLPVFWQEEASKGWAMSLWYKDNTTLPYKIDIKHIRSERKAVLIIKERASDLDLFTSTQMRLIYPEDTQILPLEELQER